MQKQNKIEELKDIPAVDKIQLDPAMQELSKRFNKKVVTYAIKTTLDELRGDLLQNKGTWTELRLIEKINKLVVSLHTKSLKRVINATGIILHTNLGRAPLGKKVLEEIAPIIEGYSNLELDLDSGDRGDRNDHVTELIKYITNSEAALVVNNNAAAVLHILKTFANKKEVIVSRGELIEIGGSFRLPDVMKTSGAQMVEVGSTNRTRISDYEDAVTKNTSIIFKAHKSNYYMRGFTEEVGLEKLAKVAHENELLMVYDVGSGLLRQPTNGQIKNEPDIKSLVKKGADLICFSGDKLLGGPQAGIIVGKKKYITKLAKAPLYRALRVGKLSLSALATVIKFYLQDDQMKNNKIFEILDMNDQKIKERAARLKNMFDEENIDSVVKKNVAKTGGGTVPAQSIPSYAVQLKGVSNNNLHEKIFQGLMQQERPIVAILKQRKIYFDVLTIDPVDFQHIVSSVKVIIS